MNRQVPPPMKVYALVMWFTVGLVLLTVALWVGFGDPGKEAACYTSNLGALGFGYLIGGYRQTTSP